MRRSDPQLEGNMLVCGTPAKVKFHKVVRNAAKGYRSQ